MSSSKENRPTAAAAFSRYLRSGVRSTCEAVAYLRRRGVSSETAARLVKSGVTRGLLDDHAAARLWTEHFVEQGYAAAAIHEKLLAKGFDETVITRAVSRCAPASSEEARARTVADRHAKAPAGPRAAARITRALAARGFDAEMIERVVNERLACTSIEESTA